MVGGCSKASMDMLPSPTLDKDGSIRFGIPQGGGCDVCHRSRECLLSDFHSLPYLGFALDGSLPVQGTLIRAFHSSTGLH